MNSLKTAVTDAIDIFLMLPSVFVLPLKRHSAAKINCITAVGGS